jgi:ribonuclease HI
MSRLITLVDSSTIRASSTSKYGESIVAWTARWNTSSNPIVARAGVEYMPHEGPNKAFYDGVIRCLQSCYHMCYPNDEMVIYGDCLLVINQINGKPWTGSSLTPFWNQVQKLADDYRCPVNFVYMPRTADSYQEVDQMAKRARGFFRHSIGR